MPKKNKRWYMNEWLKAGQFKNDANQIIDLNKFLKMIRESGDNLKLREQYELIQQFRFMLSHEELNYRVLVDNKVVEISGASFFKYIQSGGINTIQLNAKKLADNVEKMITQKQKIDGLMFDEDATDFFQTIFQKFQKAGIIELAKSSNDKKLYSIVTSMSEQDGKIQKEYARNSKGEIARYNMGDAFENLDILFNRFFIDDNGEKMDFTEFRKLSKLSDEEFFQTSMFQKLKNSFQMNWRHDSSKGSTSGDYARMRNGITSWIENKANSADIMQRTQIEKQFGIIQRFAKERLTEQNIVNAYNEFFSQNIMSFEDIMPTAVSIGMNLLQEQLGGMF